MRAKKLRAMVLETRRFAANSVRVKLLGRRHILPYFALYYATYRCNCGCSWCSRSKQVHDGEQVQEANLERTREFLAQVRRLVPILYVTGGEPLVLDDIEERLEIASGLGFYPLVINTNAVLLDSRPRVLKLVDKLVVSLHTVDPAKLAKTYHVSPQLADRALANVKSAAASARTHGAQVMANCVLTADNVAQANEVMDFCLEHGIQLAVVPAVVGQQPMIQSASAGARREYALFMDRVIAQKMRSLRSVQGTLAYNRRIRALGSFECRPTAMLPISPDGQVVNPCDVHYSPIGRIGSGRSVLSVMQAALDYQQRFRPCAGRCLKACYTQPALMMERPWQAVVEYLWRQ